MPFAQHHYPFENADAGRARRRLPPRRLHLRGGRPDARLVLHPARARRARSSIDVAYEQLHRHGPRQRRAGAQDVEAPRQRRRPDGACIEETGADALRWYFYVNDPEQPSRFSARLVREAAQGLHAADLERALVLHHLRQPRRLAPGRARPRHSDRRAPRSRPLDPRCASTTEIEQVTLPLEGYSHRRAGAAARELRRRPDQLVHPAQPRPLLELPAAPRADAKSSNKEAAYQTLYAVLTTLARLIAPFTPFLAETLHEHLVRSPGPDGAA